MTSLSDALQGAYDAAAVSYSDMLAHCGKPAAEVRAIVLADLAAHNAAIETLMDQTSSSLVEYLTDPANIEAERRRITDGVRTMRADGWSVETVARRYGITPKQVRALTRRKDS